jgi:SAM-dependent methyltransferase
MAFTDLGRLTPGGFDGVFSNFGGLNCAENLVDVLRETARALRPDGVFIACLLNSLCLWESIAFAARGEFQQSRRRFRQPLSARIGNGSVPVTYQSPSSFARAMNPWFTVEECYGLSICSPPPNSLNIIRRFPRLTGMLLRLDGVMRRVPPFRSLGDHFVMIARKKNA